MGPGGVSPEQIREFGGDGWSDVILAKKTAGKSEPVRTPGMKYRHYSPTARVILFVGCGDGRTAVRKYVDQHPGRVALLRSKQFVLASEMGISVLSDKEMGTSAAEVARNLFRLLREVDESGVDMILVEAVDEVGDGLAVMNRLSKAASETVVGKGDCN